MATLLPHPQRCLAECRGRPLILVWLRFRALASDLSLGIGSRPLPSDLGLCPRISGPSCPIYLHMAQPKVCKTPRFDALRWVPSPPNSATTTLLPHPQCLGTGCHGRPLNPHSERRNSVGDLTLLAAGHEEMSPMPSLECGEWCKPFLSNLLAPPRSTKGCSSFKCRPLLTYLPADGSTKGF